MTSSRAPSQLEVSEKWGPVVHPLGDTLQPVGQDVLLGRGFGLETGACGLGQIGDLVAQRLANLFRLGAEVAGRATGAIQTGARS